MKTINVHQAKTQLSMLLRQVEDAQESYLICRNGKPVADLVPHRQPNRLQPHPVLSRIEIKYDPTEPLAADEWQEAD